MTYDVIIPTFNHGSFIREAIESARSQTVAPRSIIVVDDGSTDFTKEAVKSLSMIEYLWQPNSGLSSARNAGLDLASAEMVVFLDADDRLSPTFAEHCLRTLARSNESYSYSSVQFFGNDERFIPAPPFSLDILKHQNFISSTSMIDRKLASQIRFDTSFQTWADWEFFMHAASRGFLGAPSADAVFFYRKHQTPISMFDRTSRDPTALLSAKAEIQRKHPSMYRFRERLETNSRLQAASIRRRLTRVQQ
ncbi:MAG: glycosyltransferase family 2 protein [Actinobacteria bacterium]|nr:glycosyltransferase family 2 protein [Actinomycetota bacterium]